MDGIKEEYDMLKKKYEDNEKQYMELVKLYSDSNKQFDDISFIMGKIAGLNIPSKNLINAYTQLRNYTDDIKIEKTHYMENSFFGDVVFMTEKVPRIMIDITIYCGRIVEACDYTPMYHVELYKDSKKLSYNARSLDNLDKIIGRFLEMFGVKL